MEHFKEIIELFKQLKRSHLLPDHFITNVGYKLVEETPEPSIKMIELVTYTSLEDHKKREIFDDIDTTGFDHSVTAGFYYAFMYNYIFNKKYNEGYARFSISEWIDIVAEDTTYYPYLKNDEKLFAPLAKQAFKVSFKKVTYDDFEAHRDEMSTGTWPKMKGEKAQEIVLAFNALLRGKGAAYDPIFQWISE